MTPAFVRLHDYWRSSACYRVRIALHWKSIAYQAVPVNLLAGEQRAAAHRRVHPLGAVPVLEVDGHVLTQSLAMLDYLEQRWPKPALFPAEPLARADAWAKALLVVADIHPLNNLRVLRWLEQDGAPLPELRRHWIAHWMTQGCAALEAMAGDTAYLCGDTPSIADLCLVPQLYNARRFAVPLDAFPRLVAIDARCQALPAFAAAHPDRQPDRPPDTAGR